MKEAYIVSGFRTAVGKAGKGAFRFTRSDELGIAVIKHLVSALPNVDPKTIDDVIVGCANPEGEQGLQIGRQIALNALGIDVPGLTVNRYCASGLETISIAVAKIRAGMGDIFIAGGIESMSMIPMTGYKLALNYNVAKDHPDYLVGMGLTAEAVSKKFKITREAQDEFSFLSHKKAAAALENGKFNEQIVPIQIEEIFVQENKKSSKKYTVNSDEGVRKDTTIQALAGLKPVFATDGTITAGNSSQTSDGAAFVMVMSEKKVKELGLSPIARMVSCSVAGVEPIIMGVGPCVAIPKALQQANLSLGDIQMIELNEAFAAQALAVIQEANLDPSIVNVNGGAIALGHPLGCTGAKLTVQLIHEMKLNHQKYGMVTACVGGGQGIAGIFEVM